MDRFRIGSSTLNLIMSRYKALELTIDELEAMSPKEVENIFYPQKNLQRKEVPLPDFQYYYDRIHAPNSRVNISFCWLDYKEKNPDGYEKSQFYEYYQHFVQENYGGTKISMAVNRKPGEKMYIDWVGDQPGLLTDVTTGEIMRVHIFATTLGVLKTFTDYTEEVPVQFIQFTVEENHPWAGSKIKDILLPPETLLVQIQRDEKDVTPNGDTVLVPGDTLILSAKAPSDVDGVRLIEIELDGSHKWVGKSLSRIHLGKGKLVVMIQRGEELIIPNGNTVFAPGDTIVIKER